MILGDSNMNEEAAIEYHQIIVAIRERINMTNHGGKRPNAGRPTKKSAGKRRSKNLHATIPWELWESINAQRLAGEGTSQLIQRLLSQAKQA
jgi:hypothetical protein